MGEISQVNLVPHSPFLGLNCTLKTKQKQERLQRHKTEGKCIKCIKLPESEGIDGQTHLQFKL